jgi:hypothetical protein
MIKVRERVSVRELLKILLFSILLTTAIMPSPITAASSSGIQVMPISINGWYVLFPGNKSPFLRSGRLMVPIRAFSDIIGAHVEYNSKSKSVTIRSLGQSVSGIRAGQLGAVFHGDLGYSLGVKPEVHGGTMFVPAAPILRGLKSYSWEIMSNNVNKKTLLIKDKEQERLLWRIKPLLLNVPFPVQTTVHPSPFYPTVLSQAIINGKGDAVKAYRLTISIQNTSGAVIRVGTAEFELIYVDREGKTAVRKLTGPTMQILKAAQSMLTLDIPEEAGYVLFRSRTLKEGHPSSAN